MRDVGVKKGLNIKLYLYKKPINVHKGNKKKVLKMYFH